MKKDNWNELLQKADPKLLFGLGIAGMLLLLLSEFWPQQKELPAVQLAESSASGEQLLYEQQLEQRLEQLLGQMAGVGQVQVMVTLSSSEQAVFATDTSYTGSGEAHQDHVLLSNGTALQQTTLVPAVNGVAVICQGGGEITVIARITEVLAALLDISTNRISVQQMK
ncbi:MAG: stage III sporulation protein AG [Faecalibacterium sp.]|nr:stage III sporulation protein AG [Faecalibacterium sp.]